MSRPSRCFDSACGVLTGIALYWLLVLGWLWPVLWIGPLVELGLVR